MELFLCVNREVGEDMWFLHTVLICLYIYIYNSYIFTQFVFTVY